MFAGCTCNGSKPVPVPTPRPQVVAPTATRVVPAASPTQVVQPATATVAPAATPTAAPAAAVDSARRAECERYVAVLSGRTQDRALLDNPEVRGLALQLADLVTCGAVLSDSDALCSRLIPEGHGPSGMCRHTRAMLHELRNYPKGRSFLFDEIDWKDCHEISSLPPTYCDTFRDAMRSGDPKDCARTGDGATMCRAYLNLDKSSCRLEGKLREAVVELPHRKEGEPKGKVKVERVLTYFCEQAIVNRGAFKQGLKALAESGSPREREFARAALGEPDACASFAQSAMEICMGLAAPTSAPAGTPAAPGSAATDQKAAAQPATPGTAAAPADKAAGATPGAAPAATAATSEKQ